VVLEAEHGERANGQSHNWLLKTRLPGYTGTSYLQSSPDIDALIQTGEITTSPRADYLINFTTAETYTVWVRGYAPNAAGDSVYVGFDGQWVGTLTGFVSQQWSWANANMQAGGQAVVVNVTRPGAHTLQLWPREDGLSLDRLLLTTNGAYVPIGNGPPESEIR
jgi:hypothetical protein